LSFCKFVLKHKAFTSGNFDTHFVKEHFSPEMLNVENDDEAIVAALFGAKLMSTKKTAASNIAAESAGVRSLWKANRS
jgi:propionyl-CoA carboxylase alpha chain